MASKKKLTLRQQYQKQISRLQRYQKRYEKLGYKFEQPLAPELPARVTKKRLQQIQEIKPRKIKGEDLIAIRKTGEIVAGYETPQEKQQGYVPTVRYSDQIIELINALPDNRFAGKNAVEVTPLKETMINALYDTMAEYDTEEQYEEYLGTVYSDIQLGLEAIELSSDQTQIIANFSKALSLIKGKPLTMTEATTVSDYSETLGDYEM